MTRSSSSSDPLDPTSVNPPATHDISAPKEEEQEKVYYEGSPLVRGSIGSRFLVFLIGAIFFAVPIVYRYLQHVWLYLPLTIACFVIGLILFLTPIVYSRTIRYRISNFRIDYERGFLGKTIDTTELWHVEDIQFHQSLLERLLGVGTIKVFAADQTTPSFPLRGLPKPREIFDALKARVIAIKRSRGVIKMDT
jgi:membrane protein YdbS with pleckstrin-like domain